MVQVAFGGDKKKGQSLLGPLERRFIDRWVGSLPSFLRSWHLTLMTVIWSAGTMLFGWLASRDRSWLWAMSLMVAAQWFTDSFDGSLGKTRGEGLIKWGFFMDHFLDTIFAGSVVIAYTFIGPANAAFLFQLLLLVTCAMMALSFLSFGATNEFQIAHYGIGPTEIRIGYIAVNTFVYYAGPTVFWWGLPLVLAVNVATLVTLAVRTSNRLWTIDKAAARSSSERDARTTTTR